MGYLVDPSELQVIERMPHEGRLRRLPTDQFAARLKTERSLHEAGLVAHAGDNRLAVVLIALDGPAGHDLASTLASLAVQSHPGMRVAIIARSDQDPLAIRKFVAKQKLKPAVTEVWPQFDEAEKRAMAKCAYVILLHAGDQLHPSALSWLSLEGGGKKTAPGLIWGMIQPDEAGNLAWAQRNGRPSEFELWHVPALSNAIAVPTEFAVRYPGDLVDELLHNELHIFQLWLTCQNGFDWVVHPEMFLIRAPRRAASRDSDALAARFKRYEAAYRAFFAEAAPEFQFFSHGAGAHTPYHLAPRREAGAVSVIIPFRDRVELTVRAVRSIWSQDFDGFVEIILINNQSTDSSLDTLKKELKRAPGAFTSKILSYDKPFNHSAQCNQGIRAAIGEVIVLFNNDCTLISQNALNEMVAWATRDGVGTVGIAHNDPDTDRVSAGIEARITAPTYFDSIVEENSTEFLTYQVRETFGNTFACAALSRRNLNRCGPLDETRFPNGYNDVEYNCRMRKAGLKHMTLGHIFAEHAPGQSRSKTDESAQKILLRLMYPETMAAALIDTRDDTLLARLADAGPGGAVAKSTAKPAAPTSVMVPGKAVTKAPARPAAVRAPLHRRVLSRVAATSISQRILANPQAYRVLRRLYRMVVRPR
jgi:GT2 family glycosyltransferase